MILTMKKKNKQKQQQQQQNTRTAAILDKKYLIRNRNDPPGPRHRFLRGKGEYL